MVNVINRDRSVSCGTKSRPDAGIGLPTSPPVAEQPMSLSADPGCGTGVLAGQRLIHPVAGLCRPSVNPRKQRSLRSVRDFARKEWPPAGAVWLMS